MSIDEGKKQAEKQAKKQASAERVQAAKVKIQKKKKVDKAKGIRITAKLLKGKSVTDEVPVKLITGEVGLLPIRALGEGEIIEIFADVGMDRINNMGSGELDAKDYDFFWSLVSVSSGIKKALIKQSFALGESAKAGQAVLELSGFGADAETEVESFPKE